MCVSVVCINISRKYQNYSHSKSHVLIPAGTLIVKALYTDIRHYDVHYHNYLL